MRTSTKTAFIALSLSALVLVIGLVGCASTTNSILASTATPTFTATFAATETLAPTATLTVHSVVHGKTFSISLPAGWTTETVDNFAGGGAYTPLPGNFGITTILHQSSASFIAIDEIKPAPVVVATYCQAVAANSATIAGLLMQHHMYTAPGKDWWQFVNKSNVSYDIVIASDATGQISMDPAQRDLLMQVLATFKPLDSASACS
jgi:hypothetical protein